MKDVNSRAIVFDLLINAYWSEYGFTINKDEAKIYPKGISSMTESEKSAFENYCVLRPAEK